MNTFRLRPISVFQSQRGGIMDIFRTAAPAQPPAQPDPGTKQTQQTAPNGTVPDNTVTQKVDTPDPNVQTSPLDKHKDVWNSPAPAADKPIFDGLDPAKVREAIAKNDLTQGILTPELSAKIAAGGEGAVHALQEVMNKVGQESLSRATLSTTSIVEAALAKQAQSFKAELPNIVKRLSAADGLITENPLVNNPVIKPIAEALQESFQRKNPNATAKELQIQVMDVLSAVGEAFAAKPADTTSTKKANGEQDWGKFLGI